MTNTAFRTTPFVGSELDAARHNLALAQSRGKDQRTLDHLAANVVRAERRAAGITDMSDL